MGKIIDEDYDEDIKFWLSTEAAAGSKKNKKVGKLLVLKKSFR